MVCSACHEGECEDCVDVSRTRTGVFSKTICQCQRKGHNIEAPSTQILDPESGTVFAPGLQVSIDGTVTFNDPRCSKCHFRHKPDEECITL